MDGSLALFYLLPHLPPVRWLGRAELGEEAKALLSGHQGGVLWASTALPAVLASFQMPALQEEQMYTSLRCSKETLCHTVPYRRALMGLPQSSPTQESQESSRPLILHIVHLALGKLTHFLPCQRLGVLLTISFSQLSAFRNLKLDARIGP